MRSPSADLAAGSLRVASSTVSSRLAALLSISGGIAAESLSANSPATVSAADAGPVSPLGGGDWSCNSRLLSAASGRGLSRDGGEARRPSSTSKPGQIVTDASVKSQKVSGADTKGEFLTHSGTLSG